MARLHPTRGVVVPKYDDRDDYVLAVSLLCVFFNNGVRLSWSSGLGVRGDRHTCIAHSKYDESHGVTFTHDRSPCIAIRPAPKPGREPPPKCIAP